MSSTPIIKRLTPSRIECTVTFGEEDVGPAEAKALEHVGSQLHLKGFRPGKAPLDMVRAQANKDQVFEEMVRELLRLSLPTIIESNQLKPIMAPKVEAVSRFPLTLKIIFVEYPKVTVKNSDKLTVAKKDVKADPKDVQRVLDSVLAEQRTYKPVERPSMKGDRVILDFHAHDEAGNDIPELKTQGYDVLIGEASLLPGFEEELVGITAGGNKVFTLTLPEKYQAEHLRGKPVTFHVSASRVEETKTPELTDELAKEKLNAESAKAFRDMVENSIKSQEEQFERTRRERELLEEITKRTEADIAPEILEEETRMLIQDFSQRLEQQGTNIQDWLEREAKKPEEVEADFRKQAEDRAKLRFGVAKLIEERAIKLSDEELEEAVATFFASVPQEQQSQARADVVPGSQMYQELQWRATVDKLMQQLLA